MCGLSLLQKVKSGMGSPDWIVSILDIHLQKLLWVYCPGHAGVKGNKRADRLAGKATLQLASRKIWSVEKLETLPAGTKHRLEERGVETGSVRRSSLKGRETAIDTGTVSKATLGKLLRDGVERIWAFPSAWIPSWIELNWNVNK